MKIASLISKHKNYLYQIMKTQHRIYNINRKRTICIKRCNKHTTGDIVTSVLLSKKFIHMQF